MNAVSKNMDNRKIEKQLLTPDLVVDTDRNKC